MLVRYFNTPYTVLRDSNHSLLIACVTALSAWACLFIDTDSSLWQQNILGFCAWGVLLFFLLFESRLVQAQILVAVLFATIGEYFSSVFMEGYTYRLSNVPAFVPPGHGLVYLSAVALGRSLLFAHYRKNLLYFAIISGTAWSVWGVLFAVQQDVYGALLFIIFLLALYFGRSTMVYLGAYYITTYLELVGTWVGTWQWTAIDPIFGLTQGNPPSGVAAWYCLVDAVALGLAPLILYQIQSRAQWPLFRFIVHLEQRVLLRLTPLVYQLLRIKKIVD